MPPRPLERGGRTWRPPTEHEFGAQRRSEREVRRAWKRFAEAQPAGPTTIDDEDPRWDELWTNTDDTTSEFGGGGLV